MARIQVSSVAFDVSGGGVASLAPAFGSPVTSGNTIVLFVRAAFTGGPVTGVADTRSTSYSTGPAVGTSDPFMWSYYGIAPSTGSCTITVSFGSGNALSCWAYAVEYSNAGSLFDSGSARINSGGVDVQSEPADINTTGATLLVAAASITGFSGYNQTFSAGADFTLVDGTIGAGAGNDFGGVQEYFAPTALSGYTIHFTTDTNGTPGLLWLAFADLGNPKRGCFVAGVTTTVKANRAAAFGLDGNVNIHDEDGKLKVFGDFEVTGTVTMANPTITNPASLFNRIVTSGGSIVLDSNGNVVFV